MMKAFASWSGGKESCFSCYKAISDGHEVSHLLNMATIDAKRSMTHEISSGMLHTQSECIGIPLVQKRTTWNAYEQDFKDAVRTLKQEDIEAGVFGDIDLQGHGDWVERVCAETGIKAMEPLWGMKREGILEDFIDAGFEAIVVCTKADVLGEEWLGHRIDDEFIGEMQRQGIDICGEGGEYHTFVTDGPLFKKRIEILHDQKILKDGYWLLDIQKYETMEK